MFDVYESVKERHGFGIRGRQYWGQSSNAAGLSSHETGARVATMRQRILHVL